MSAPPDAIVIGAGVAGLAAATALSEAGMRVLVLEARGVLGGRASSFQDPTTGDVVDNGQHVVLGCYVETFAYLDRIGARGGIALQPRLEVAVIDRQGMASALRCPDWPSPWHLLAGVLRWRALGWRDRFSAVRLVPQLRRARQHASGRIPLPAALDGETVASWLARHGQTPRLCELLWEPLAVAALNQPTTTAAAAPFVRVLGGVCGPSPRDAAIGLPSRPLSEVFGVPARRYLESRGSIVRCHAPARLGVTNGRVTHVDVRGERFCAGTIIAAIPWGGWRTLLDESSAEAAGLTGLRRAALRRRPSPIVTVNLWLDRDVLETSFLGLPGRTFQWIFRKSFPVDGKDRSGRGHLSLVSSGAYAIAREPDDTLVALACDELRHALASAAAATVRHSSVVRERHATFSLAPGEPPRPSMQTPADRLWLAGDWTDTGLPATLEGAIDSGHRVARAILQQVT